MNKNRTIIAAFVVLLISLFVALLLTSILSVDDAALSQHLLLKLTLPLAITAILVGAALPASAACLQVLLSNPLADPSIIGISSGASLFAAFIILSGLSGVAQYFHYWLPFACFVGALLSTLLIYLIARRLQSSPVAVVLAGVAISTLSGAVIGWLYYFADAQAMRNLTFWLMGSLYQADSKILYVATPIIVISLAFVVSKASALNRLYLGNVNAKASGIDVVKLNKQLLLACSLLVGVSVAIAGSIAFIGLLIPHVMRLCFGFDNRLVIVVSALCGASLLLVIAIASEIWAITTFPVSMLTASIGGPLFIYALLRGQFNLNAGRS